MIVRAANAGGALVVGAVIVVVADLTIRAADATAHDVVSGAARRPVPAAATTRAVVAGAVLAIRARRGHNPIHDDEVIEVVEAPRADEGQHEHTRAHG
jgi:hypothetical protein